ncbi:hypothetical protein, variant 1 [Aphanomyces invadans]|uniref:Uncharacterized protein n=1 Tax=Aphanomyces invadans TaxID=157072 RepID=A0A024UD88_9STRA|nr:hypothetical protein, variant 1 [Aphanomyces invadans]ETW04180.1 hypothetical protein, variant 1 [Aphanomyces invadans]|eukprot:XP_008867136.1 hypothetical protein, variant 1 [Aphanomyces invadans]
MPLSYVVEIIEGAYTRLGPNGGLIALNPHIPVEFRTEWFLTPKQHALETLAFSLLYGSIAYYCHCRAINSDAWKALRPVRAYYYKHIAPGSWRVAYMLQPCHVLTATIAILSVLPGRWANYIFQVMVTLTWSSVVAMAFPDLSDYTHKGDMFNYWYEHALILVLPIALSRCGRFTYLGNWHFIVLGYATTGLYHCVCLQIAALATNVNVATMASPPQILAHLGVYYRAVQYAICFVLHLVYNGIIVAGCSLLSAATQPKAADSRVHP